GLEREIHVEVDPVRLEGFGLSINDIETALAAANASAPGGTIRRGRYRYSLRTLGELTTVQQISEVPLLVRANGGSGPGRTGGAGQTGATRPQTILLRDVARVVDGY